MKKFLIEYAKHSILNLGQALHSSVLRAGVISNDFYFAIFPPHWHHTPEEISSFHVASMKQWFMYGYCAWRFDENGSPKTLAGNEDRRWDPRCK